MSENWIGVMPASGKATRIYGLPKFLLPIFGSDLTLLGRHLTSFENGGIHSVAVATRPGSCSLIYDHLPQNCSLLATNTETMSETVCRLRSLTGNKNIAFSMPDTYMFEENPWQKLKKAVEDGADIAVGVFKIRDEQRGKLGQCCIENEVVTKVVDKDPTCSYEWAWGLLAWKPTVWELFDPKTPHIGYALNPAIEKGLKVVPVYMDGDYYDCGTPNEFRELLLILSGNTV